tara:strand:+ start:303 stop:479 length:177 start_codon:yes stop_codon:yes gene_type:complete
MEYTELLEHLALLVDQAVAVQTEVLEVLELQIKVTLVAPHHLPMVMVVVEQVRHRQAV